MSEDYYKSIISVLKNERDEAISAIMDTKKFWCEHLQQQKELDNSRIEQLQNDVINAEMNLQIMTNLFEQAKEMLRKLNPIIGYGSCFLCGEIRYAEHKPNCEYIKMIGDNYEKSV